MPFDELLPYAKSRRELRDVLFIFLQTGCTDIHVHSFPCEETATDKPRASRLARYMAARTNLVTNACNLPVSLDEGVRRLIVLLDGTRTHDEIARALASESDAPAFKEIRNCLPSSLSWLAQMALLER